MEHVVVMSTMEGEAIAAGDYSCIRSENPLPVPNVGEKVYVPGGCGPDGQQAAFFEVVDRLFTYTPDENAEGRVRVELFCQGSGAP